MHASPDMRNSSISKPNRRLFADQVHKQYEHIILGTAATLINGIILVLVLSPHVRFMTLIIWLVCAGMVSICRLLLCWYYRRSATQYTHPEKWNAWFVATIFLAGVLWGSTAIFLFPPDSTGHQVFIAFVTGGMVAGAVGAFTAVFASFIIFSIPALLPICVRFLLLGTQIHIAMGAMVFLFLLIMIFTASRMHKNVLALLALRYERSALIAELQQEVLQRKEAQEDLRRQKEQVEEIVAQRTDQLRKSEEQLQRAQKMEALGRLAGGVAHDLNNILSGIVSYPELLLMDLTRESPLWRPLATIKKAGENAAAIVQDLLTLARRGVATLELLNLNKIVEACLASTEVEPLLRLRPDIHVETALQPDLLNFYGSSVHIRKTVSNLITNAVEAMPQGGRIEITTGNRYADEIVSGFDTVKEGEYVVLSIEDSGMGISESDRVRIFEPFYSRKVMGQSGSGLGMAVVWGTVKDHNGYIDIASEEGRGTRLDLFFPATRDQLKLSQKSEDLSDVAGNGEFILVVDDMPIQREIATSILLRLGYRCQSVSSGEEAVAFLKQHTADLVLLDMIMAPGIDGSETYRRIQSIRPGQKAIIASGYSETEEVRKTQSLGAGQYIKKPYTLKSIGQVIKAELKNDRSN